jgi:hypothetical protein
MKEEKKKRQTGIFGHRELRPNHSRMSAKQVGGRYKKRKKKAKTWVGGDAGISVWTRSV